MKRVLIVSPHWPPVNAPDLQRVRMSLPYYSQHGYEVTVLTVDARDVYATLEPELVATVPVDASVEKVRVDLPRLWKFLSMQSLGLRA
ncbi:MAG: glycosyltransferase family 4 protein [Blastochloris sp.]|nr:glycosyltransferase family 4 protein [Blastochloris sp.]